MPEDVEQVIRVQVQGWKESYQGIIDQAVLDSMAYSEERVKRRKGFFLSNPTLRCFIALQGNKIIGFVDAGASRDPFLGKGEVLAIYLLNEYKRQGIGKALWTAATDYLKQQQLVPYIVWGLKDNLPARKFYEKMGGQLIHSKELEIGSKLYAEVCYGFEMLIE